MQVNGQVHIQTFIEQYQASAKTESKTDTVTGGATPTQKQALRSIAVERNVGVSTIIGEALDMYIELMPYRDKILKHRDTIIVLLKSLS